MGGKKGFYWFCSFKQVTHLFDFNRNQWFDLFMNLECGKRIWLQKHGWKSILNFPLHQVNVLHWYWRHIYLSIFFWLNPTEKQVNKLNSELGSEEGPLWYWEFFEALSLSLGTLGKWKPSVHNLFFNYFFHFLQDQTTYPWRAFDLEPFLLCQHIHLIHKNILLLIVILAYLKFSCLNVQFLFLSVFF